MKKILFLLLVTLTFNACTHIYTRKGMYYRVSEGDTLAKISSKYKVSAQEIAEENNIESSQQLKPGRSIYIPGMTPRGLASLIEKSKKTSKSQSKNKPKIKTKVASRKTQKGKPQEQEKIETDDRVVLERGRFSWPIQGEISSPFGMRHGRRHDGIDIRSPIGAPIAAAAAGEVVFAKRMRGYGNLVLLKHEDDFFTVYAHNSANLVKLGQKVKKGQIIAKVGRTGRATGPHLHFEVRENTKSRNPLFFLPKNEYTKKIAFEEAAPASLKENEEEAPSSDEHADIDESEPLEEKVDNKMAVKPKKVVVVETKSSQKVVAKKKLSRARPEKKISVKPVHKEKKNGRTKK
ncbi:MAG: M23 family metallopeptidase [Deltaproteobacteria bacterium]|nr:MAG: M23 family metallopeptidase [Deltaproteobacteria bacterium]